jgi:hypothetical protein
MRCGLESSGLELRLLVGSCEHGNEPPGSIRCQEFLELLSFSGRTQLPGFM